MHTMYKYKKKTEFKLYTTKYWTSSEACFPSNLENIIQMGWETWPNSKLRKEAK